jgi:hypothetical protein
LVQGFGPAELPKNIGWFVLLGMKESISFKRAIIINNYGELPTIQ